MPIIARNTGQPMNALLPRNNNTQNSGKLGIYPVQGILGQTEEVIIMAFQPGISGNPVGRPHQTESNAGEGHGRGLSNG